MSYLDWRLSFFLVTALTAWFPADVWRSLRAQEATPQEHAICGRPFWVHVTDHDQNGTVDVLTVANLRNHIEIGQAFGDGRGSFSSCSAFQEHLALDIASAADGVVFGDFDGDGVVDIALTDGSGNPPELGVWGHSRILLFLSDGEVFEIREAVTMIERRSGFFPLTAGDVDADGNLDIVFGTARASEGFVQLNLGDGEGNFESAGELTWSLSAEGIPEDIEIADFDGDGSKDLAILFQNDATRTIRVYLNSGRGDEVLGLQPVWETRFEATNYRTRIRAGIFSSDDRIDLVVVSGREIDRESQVLRFQGLGNGTFQASPISYPVSFPVVESLVADFDEDGVNDLLIHGEVVFQVLLSSEQFQAQAPNPYLFQPRSAPHTAFKAGDFDGDGHLDLVSPDSATFLDGEPTIVLIRGLGDGRFEALSGLEGSCGQYGGAGFGDFNEDGVIDIVAFEGFSGDLRGHVKEPCMLLGLPGAAEEGPFFEFSASYPPSRPVLSGNSGRPVVADFNSDGHLDVAEGACVPSEVTPGFVVRFGDGQGALGEPVLFDVPGPPCVGPRSSSDFNHDGRADLLVRQNPQTWSVLVANGDGGFTRTWTEDWRVSDHAVVDFNEDGFLDLVFLTTEHAEEHESAVWFLPGTGDGTFGVGRRLIDTAFFAGGSGLFLIVEDFNNDEAMDIMVSWRATGNEPSRPRDLRLFLRGEDGEFSADPIISLTPGLPVARLKSADVNVDGSPDVVLLQWEERIGESNRPYSLKVLYGIGDGSFSRPSIISTRLVEEFYIRQVNSDDLPDFLLFGGGLLSQGMEIILQEEISGDIFLRGDCNGDGVVDISDAVCTLNWLFLGTETPDCAAATNTNSDQAADISDVTYLLNHLFLGGPAPHPPFPNCGPGLLPIDGEVGCNLPPKDCP